MHSGPGVTCPYREACETLFIELKDQFLAWLGKQDPEDVFDDNALASWAARHGYYSREP